MKTKKRRRSSNVEDRRPGSGYEGPGLASKAFSVARQAAEGWGSLASMAYHKAIGTDYHDTLRSMSKKTQNFAKKKK